MDDTDWSLIDFSDPTKAGVEKSTPVFHCPKCGRPLKRRGQHLHIRKCKVKANDNEHTCRHHV